MEFETGIDTASTFASPKVEALSKRIVEECEKQGFTVGDFRSLVASLSILLKRRCNIDGETF